MQGVVELTVVLTRLASATYTLQKMRVTDRRTLLFRTTVSIRTDRLLVSSEAVRVLDSRE